MGLQVLIGSRGEHSLTTEVNQGLHIDLDDHESALAAIIEEDGQRPFAGIIGSDDSTVELAAHAASRLGLPHNVINTGRRRSRAPAKLASASGSPPSCSPRTWETSTTPFRTAMPNRAMNPTPALMLSGIPRSARAKMPPTEAKGTFR